MVLGLGIMPLTACQTIDNLTSDLEYASNEGIVSGTTNAVVPMQESESLLASPCPQVTIVDDLSSLSDFIDPRKTSSENLISRIDLGSTESTCKLASTSAIVDLKLVFNGKLGPKGRQKSSDKPFFSYPFFVAVTAPSGKIMAKEIFSASLSYNSGSNTHTYFENLRQVIPIASKEQARNYLIYVGFQLTPDQLQYNRANMVPIASAEAAEKEERSFVPSVFKTAKPKPVGQRTLAPIMKASKAND